MEGFVAGGGAFLGEAVEELAEMDAFDLLDELAEIVEVARERRGGGEAGEGRLGRGGRPGQVYRQIEVAAAPAIARVADDVGVPEAIAKKCAAFRREHPTPVLRVAKIGGFQGESGHEIDSLTEIGRGGGFSFPQTWRGGLLFLGFVLDLAERPFSRMLWYGDKSIRWIS